jgi:hypothetical protein
MLDPRLHNVYEKAYIRAFVSQLLLLLLLLLLSGTHRPDTSRGASAEDISDV